MTVLIAADHAAARAGWVRLNESAPGEDAGDQSAGDQQLGKAPAGDPPAGDAGGKEKQPKPPKERSRDDVVNDRYDGPAIAYRGAAHVAGPALG
jgi:hypothetical protein